MSKSFLTTTALVALLGFGANAAVAQQSAPVLQAPAITKSAPAVTGKDAGKAVDNKAVDSKVKRDAAATCGTIKDKAAHDACMTSRAKNQTSKTPAVKSDQKSATPDKAKVAPRVGG